MKNIKKFLIVLIVAVLFLFCYGCNSENGSSSKTNSGDEFVIVTSFYPIYISAINIAKDIPNVKVINMTKPQTGCLHDYSLTPQDLVTISNANVFVINGAGMESFMSKILNQYKNLPVIEASKGISLVKDKNGETNAHVWVSISNNILQVQSIAKELSRLNPKNADKYRANEELYVKKLTDLKNKMHTELASFKNRSIITFHESFPYFAKEFGLNVAAVIERDPGTAPTPTELEATIKIVKDAKIKALFAEPQYSEKAAQAIAAETGAKIRTLDPVVSGNGDLNSYLDIMEKNLTALKEGLSDE